MLRQWRVGTVAAAAGGLVYGFSPALAQSSIGHYQLQFAVFPPLIAHLVARLLTGRGKPRRTGAVLGLLAALQALTSEEMLFNTGLAIAVGLLVAAASRVRSGWEKGSAKAWLGIAAGLMTASVVFILIAGYPLWTQFGGPLTEHGSPFIIDFFKNDLDGLVQPSRLMLVHTSGSATFADNYSGGAPEYLGYLGWPLLLVAAWTAGLLRRMLAVRVLAVTFFVLEVFSLGGTLLIVGHVLGWFKLPWYWVEGLPLASSAVVDRFSIIADGCAAALLAFAIDAAWQSVSAGASARQVLRAPGLAVRRRVMARAAILLGVAVTVVPVLPAPLPTAAVSGVPAGWTRVLADLRLPDGAGVLTVPVPTASFATPMRWVADTGLPSSVVGGAFIGPGPGGQAYVNDGGLGQVPQYLNLLWQESGTGAIAAGGLQASGPAQPPSATATWLAGSKVSAVVAVTSPGSPLASYLIRVLGPPSAQSGAVTAWRVPLSLIWCGCACTGNRLRRERRCLGLPAVLPWRLLADRAAPAARPAGRRHRLARGHCRCAGQERGGHAPHHPPGPARPGLPGTSSASSWSMTGSTDGTGAIATALGRPRLGRPGGAPLTVVAGRPRPDGLGGQGLGDGAGRSRPSAGSEAPTGTCCSPTRTSSGRPARCATSSRRPSATTGRWSRRWRCCARETAGSGSSCPPSCTSSRSSTRSGGSTTRVPAGPPPEPAAACWSGAPRWRRPAASSGSTAR